MLAKRFFSAKNVELNFGFKNQIHNRIGPEKSPKGDPLVSPLRLQA